MGTSQPWDMPRALLWREPTDAHELPASEPQNDPPHPTPLTGPSPVWFAFAFGTFHCDMEVWRVTWNARGAGCWGLRTTTSFTRSVGRERCACVSAPALNVCSSANVCACACACADVRGVLDVRLARMCMCALFCACVSRVLHGTHVVAHRERGRGGIWPTRRAQKSAYWTNQPSTRVSHVQRTTAFLSGRKEKYLNQPSTRL